MTREAEAVTLECSGSALVRRGGKMGFGIAIALDVMLRHFWFPIEFPVIFIFNMTTVSNLESKLYASYKLRRSMAIIQDHVCLKSPIPSRTATTADSTLDLYNWRQRRLVCMARLHFPTIG